jgi:hypothetical protein
MRTQVFICLTAIGALLPFALGCEETTPASGGLPGDNPRAIDVRTTHDAARDGSNATLDGLDAPSDVAEEID